jgi:NAD(P)-dependent dehydrogenase (short-subunit alcohol dehydrogenase family)
VEIAGKTALVTGAAGGIGRAIAHGLAAERAGVLVVDLDAEAGQRVLDELRAGGAEARFLAADVTNEVDVAAMGAHVERELGGLDILVNNAGDTASRSSRMHRLRIGRARSTSTCGR